MTSHFGFAVSNSRHNPFMQFLEEFLTEQVDDPGVLIPRSSGSALISALPADIFWRRFEEFGVTHVTEEGDLVFDIDDLFTPSGFWNGNIIQHWAIQQAFDIDELDGRDVLWHLLEDSLFPAMRELLPNGDELLAAFEGTQYGEPVPDLPDFRVIVNGRAAVMRTIARFDGPFASDADADAALKRRCGDVGTEGSDQDRFEF